MVARPNPEIQVAIATGIRSIATFPARPYNRLLQRIIISGPRPSIFSLYYGVLDNPANLLTTTPVGYQNSEEYMPPIPIANGIVLYAVWTSVVSTCVCTLNFGFPDVV